MKALHASASGVARRPQAEVYAVLANLAGYPDWYPSGVKRAEVRGPDRGFVIIALNEGPIQRDFDFEVALELVPESAVTLRRLPKSPGDREQLTVAWSLAPDIGDGGATNVTVDFAAELSIPGWLPLGGLEKAIPRGFLDAALAHLNS